MKYHFHITTVHKYHFFVFCLYLSCLYLCRVVMWKWYFILLPNPRCSCAFSVLIYIPTYSFIFSNVFHYSFYFNSRANSKFNNFHVVVVTRFLVTGVINELDSKWKLNNSENWYTMIKY